MTLIHGLAMVGLFFESLDSRGRHTTPLADHVSLSLSSERETYYRGEALRLRITAKNTSSVAVTAHFPGLTPLSGYAKISARDPGRTRFRELDLQAEIPSAIPGEIRAITTVRGPGQKTLHPGQHYDLEVSIASVVERGARRFLLDRIGSYEFRLRHFDSRDDPNGILESDVLTVQVAEPPPSEQDALAAYTPHLAYLAHGRFGWWPPEDIRTAASLVERFASSRYTPLVRDSLLRMLEYRKHVRRASDEEVRLYERLSADVDQIPRPRLVFAPSLSVLWPADDSMVPLTVLGGMEDHTGEKDLTARVTLESITCDDSCDLASDVAGAELGTDDREFELRASRGKSGVGRTYTITYSAANAEGKGTKGGARIAVPAYETPPAWSDQNVMYKSGEPVTYKGEVWRAIGGAVGRPEFPPPETLGWVKVPKGKAWDFPVRYLAGAEVTHLGLTYRCLERHISKGDEPPRNAPARWTRIP